jgi:hypothetical protein
MPHWERFQAKTLMAKPIKLFIEQHEDGWAVEKQNAKRVSALESTQAKAIARAQEINPKAELHIQGLNGKWGKKNPFDPS